MYNSQNTADLIKKLLFNRKITAKSMCIECNLGVNTLSNIRRGDVKSVETFMTIADYLDCSVDYLLCRSATPEINQPVKEQSEETNVDENSNSLKPNYNKLNAIGKQKADEYIADLAENPKYTQDNKIMQDMLTNDLAPAFSKNKVQN